MLFSRRCPGCGRQARVVCPVCLHALTLGPHHPEPADLARLAEVCGLDSIDAAFGYGQLASGILLAAKNGGRRDVLSQLAGWLPVVDEPVDAVAWVPASRSRHRQRGYDQGEVLARHLGRRIGSGHRRLLARGRNDAQAGRSRAERLAGPRLLATGRCPPRVLLVDDVATTGASLASAAAALRRAGARFVAATVLATVPP